MPIYGANKDTIIFNGLYPLGDERVKRNKTRPSSNYLFEIGNYNVAVFGADVFPTLLPIERSRDCFEFRTGVRREKTGDDLQKR